MLRKTIGVVAALLSVAGCTKTGSAPSGFGINLTIDGSALPAATLHSISSLVVTVTGEKAPYSKTLAGSTISSGTVHVQYVPGITTGTLVFEVNADNGSGTVLASGVTSAIVVQAGKAVAATVKLTGGAQTDMGMIAYGTPCAHDSDCTSASSAGHCADGVCCDTACTGTCESCNLPSTVGTCTAIAANTDPDNECPSAGIPDMGSVDAMNADLPPADLLGADLAPPYNYPDGGVKVNNLTCAGSCDGNRACHYPTGETSCGTPFCNSSSQIETPTCDGTGGCNELAPSTCVDFICGAGACKTRCTANTDCLSTDYCNVNTNSCVPKLPVATACPQGPGSCASGYCVGTTNSDGTSSGTQYCCNSACGYPNTCNKTGFEGQCQCPGTPCTGGEGCNVFYKDGDKDGYGDKSSPMAGCGTTPPSGYVAPLAVNGVLQFDCNDQDPNAFPGQTAYFTYPTVGTSSYDYNCDGSSEMQPPPYSTCEFAVCTQPGTCTAVNEQQYLAHSCRVFCLPGRSCSCELCTGSVTSGITGLGTYCGTSGGNGNATYTDCGYCTAASGSPTSPQTFLTPQPCH